MNKVCLPLFLMLSYNTINAQEFLNLGFEYGVYNAQPRKWMIEGEALSYTANLDSQLSKQGTKSLFVNLNKGSVYSYLMLPGKDVAGKRVKGEGYARFKGADSIKLILAFRDPAGKTVTSSPVSAKQDNWINVQHEMQVSNEYTSDRFLIAVVAMGSGKYWLDDFTITLNGNPYGINAPNFREPTTDELSVLNKNVINLDAINNRESIISLIGSSRIVALGENSHGSATILRYKLDLIKLLVEKAGFSVFALECPKANAEVVNGYVSNDTVDRQQAIQNLVYPSWQKQEIMDIIEWIKTYNQKSDSKVQFKGFDINPGDSQDTRETELAKNIDSIMRQSDEIKMIVSGDNSHVTKASGKMGAFVTEKYGGKYLNIGFTFQSGQYSAYGKEKVYIVHPAYIGTYEYFLSKSKYKNFILDLRKMKDLPILMKTSGFRSIGSRPQEVTQFQETEILKQFDVIVNLEKSVPTTNLVRDN